VIGIAALVGAIFMLKRMNNDFAEPGDFSFGGKKLADKGYKIGFDFCERDYYNNFQRGDKLKIAPALTFKYSW